MENDIVRMLFLRRQRQKKRWKIKTISGAPPLSFKAKAGVLKDYRIYGQTSRNLFNETIYNKNVEDNTPIYVPIYVGNVDYVTCSTTCPKTITGDNDNFNSRYIFILSGNVNTGAVNDVNGVSYGAPRTIQPSNGYVTITYRKIESNNVRPWEYQTMLNSGSTPLPYEPYGESVGDRTGNLFDGTVKNGNYTTDFSAENRVRGLSSTPINISDTMTVFNYSDIDLDIAFCVVNENGKNQIDNEEKLSFSNRLYDSEWQNNSFTYTSEYSGWLYLLFKGHTTTITKEDVTNIMLSVGSTALPYEPYGYKVPVTISNGTDMQTIPIYLPEQIRKVGDEAEYIDYEEQKLHRVGADDIDVALPELPTLAGTNVLTVGTAVQPSDVYIKGRIKKGE